MKFNIPTLVTLTAPTCAGKNFLLEAMISELGFGRVVGTTDRAERDGEIEGVHYKFLTEAQSAQHAADGAFAEMVKYNGHTYGVLVQEMELKMRPELPAPIVILEPAGIELYRKYCTLHGWAMFNIYVETNERVRVERLALRTTADILKAAGREKIEQIIIQNNKRLVMVLSSERSWSQSNRWDAIADGQNLPKALEQIRAGVVNRNSRSEIYQ